MSRFSKITKHVTPSMFVALIALVLAATGGAFAASSHGGGASSTPPAQATASLTHNTVATTSKSKKKAGGAGKPAPRGPAGPKGATGATGATGASGPAGPAGAAGAKGENGAAGTNGTDGTNGEKGETGEKGEEGSPWGVGTLPPEKTETGVWGVTGEGGLGLGKSEGEGFQYVPISFPIPLPAALPETNTHYVTIEEITNSTAPAACKGTAEKPTATPGNLCVYENAIYGAGKINTTTPFADPESNSPLNEGVGKTGGLLIFEELAKDTKGLGTWAVTAPAA